MLLKDRRIFIVEDNAPNRIVFQLVLGKHGAFLQTEQAGEEALKRLRTLNNLDLIVLDLMLRNEISGYDIFDQVRTQPEFKTVPIVAVSASDPSYAIPMAQQKGFSGFIAKPIDTDLFPQQIARIIAGEYIWDAGTRFMIG
jgi:two-component system cell cycle response regulator DivK